MPLKYSSTTPVNNYWVDWRITRTPIPFVRNYHPLPYTCGGSIKDQIGKRQTKYPLQNGPNHTPLSPVIIPSANIAQIRAPLAERRGSKASSVLHRLQAERVLGFPTKGVNDLILCSIYRRFPRLHMYDTDGGSTTTESLELM